MADTLPGLLAEAPGPDGAAAIEAADGRAPLSRAALRDLVRDAGATLAARGVGRGDRVAIVLPNGPEAATAFLASASAAVAAPLNPAFTAGEFAFYLDDLRARAVVLAAASRAGGRR